jgi:dTDP-4-amino-4,6-dideoxygalactose transaminase
MGIYSFQASKPMPTVEGGVGMYQTREYFERAAAFGHYEDPVKFAADSPVHRYAGTGFGQKYRMHPFAAAVGRQQLRRLDGQNERIAANIRHLNQHLLQLPGLSEPRCRPDQKRIYYNGNMLMFDESKAGCTRDAVIKALQAEGVHATFWNYPGQHTFPIYSEAKWWHHPPVIPAAMPGTDQVNRGHIFLPLFCEDATEINEQYAKAFEKVWTHRQELAKS